MKTLKEIKAVIEVNYESKKHTYSGLSSSEIGEYSRSIMFGDDLEAFPDEKEWSAITD